MKPFSVVLGIVIAITMMSLLPPTSIAGGKKAKSQGRVCGMSDDAIDKLYNPNTVFHIKGLLEGIKEVPVESCGSSRTKTSNVLFLTISSEVKVYSIRVGPASFLKLRDFNLRIGDQIDVDVSSIPDGSEEILLAGSIVDGSKGLALRDVTGKALWLAAQK